MARKNLDRTIGGSAAHSFIHYYLLIIVANSIAEPDTCIVGVSLIRNVGLSQATHIFPLSEMWHTTFLLVYLPKIT